MFGISNYFSWCGRGPGLGPAARSARGFSESGRSKTNGPIQRINRSESSARSWTGTDWRRPGLQFVSSPCLGRDDAKSVALWAATIHQQPEPGRAGPIAQKRDSCAPIPSFHRMSRGSKAAVNRYYIRKGSAKHLPTNVSLIFMRLAKQGCWYASLCFVGADGYLPWNADAAEKWLWALFGEDRPRVLVEHVEHASISRTVTSAARCSAVIGTVKAVLVECGSTAPLGLWCEFQTSIISRARRA